MIKQRDKEIFLQLVSAAVSGKKPESVPADTDFKALYFISRAHKETGAVWHVLKDFAPDNETERKVFESFNLYSNTIRKNMILQDYYTGIVCALCREKGIRFALLKGVALKNLYPDAVMRSSCDVDILVDKNRIDEIIEALRELGFDYHEDRDGDMAKHAKLSKDNVVLELHRMLCAKGHYGGHYDDPFSIAESADGVEYTLLPEELYVYNLAHASHHFMKGVNTLRAICDSYLIKKKYPDMDSEKLSGILKETGLSAFESGMSKLTQAVFGEIRAEGELQTVLDYVLTNPVRGDTPLSELQKEKMSGKGSRIRRYTIALRRVFPTYEYICRRYPGAKRSRLLYPFYIAKRFVQAGRQGRVRQQFDAMGRISDSEIDILSTVRKYVGIQ